LHAHVRVPGPVKVQVAFGSQPPWFVAHESIAVQLVPLPAYPELHAQLLVPGPVEVHTAFGSQPPLAVAHELIGVHVVPSPL